MTRVETAFGQVAVEVTGQGEPLLLLHGFPQTGLMWRDIAPALARRHTVVVVDLPGYGRSDPPSAPAGEHRMSKRTMSRMLVDLMTRLGHDRFAVAGHDRGARVAYRMSLDHRERITRLVLMDVIPTLEAWERADARAMLAFWPFSLLAQPAPLPERILQTVPDGLPFPRPPSLCGSAARRRDCVSHLRRLQGGGHCRSEI
jgi:haloacetate dehalogenase